jgi:transposase
VTDSKTPPEVEVIQMPRPGRRRRFSAQEKRTLVEESAQPGNSVSATARRYGISPSLLFRWKRLMEQGSMSSLGAEEPVVPESEVKQLRVRIRELERLLGKKTMEVEILGEGLKIAQQIAREKKLLSLPKSPDKDGSR